MSQAKKEREGRPHAEVFCCTGMTPQAEAALFQHMIANDAAGYSEIKWSFEASNLPGGWHPFGTGEDLKMTGQDLKMLVKMFEEYHRAAGALRLNWAAFAASSTVLQSLSLARTPVGRDGVVAAVSPPSPFNGFK